MNVAGAQLRNVTLGGQKHVEGCAYGSGRKKG